MNDMLAILDGVGGPEVLVIATLALLMFGPKRLPELARMFGRAMREFKRATSDVEENFREAMREGPQPTIRPPAKRVASRANPQPPKEESVSPSTSSAPVQTETPVKPSDDRTEFDRPF